MRIIRDTLFIDPTDRGAAAAIGNFDGVHLGHRTVIDLTRQAAKDTQAPLGIMTFEPHPRSFFAPNLARLTHVVVGSDFCFGKGRAGTVADLQAFGDEMGFGVTVAPIKNIGTVAISSTAIRAALTEGRPRDAADMLGHWHRIEGEVIRGEQRGRELGYPTANMSITGLHPPKFGVYAVKADVLDGPHAGSYHGAASIGVRPMFGENVPNCETFVFDFKGDLYGHQISIALVDYLRPELKFDGLPALIAQMDADCVQAREVLAHV